jgi:tmRNA-binding protein
MNVDISNMNKEERMDHAARLREKLLLRKKALNRRSASDDEDD